MRILQLTSDWKWTGPAQPMLVLMAALRDRGHQVDLICPEPPPGSNRNLWQEACLRGLDPLEATLASRSALRPGDGERARQLSGWLQTDVLGGPYDIVHCWHSRDHVLAARALRLLPGWRRRRGGPRLVRFLSRAGRIAPWPWHRWLFGAGCDGLVCVSEETVRENLPLRQGRPIAATTGAVALASAAVVRSRHAVRRVLGVPEEAPLVAVVARMQPHRRFDLLLTALRDLLTTHPDARLLVIGRGTRADEVVGAPARALGVESRVVHAGYRTDDYADVLAAADLCTYLVPGSDGTCRALLEAAALGLPLVGSRRGAIPDIISNGQTGRLVDETPEALASAWRALLEDPEARRAMGEAARADARVRFRPDRQAAWVERFYREVLAASAGST